METIVYEQKGGDESHPQSLTNSEWVSSFLASDVIEPE